MFRAVVLFRLWLLLCEEWKNTAGDATSKTTTSIVLLLVLSECIGIDKRSLVFFTNAAINC